jgi:shikimate dehydrogenase
MPLAMAESKTWQLGLLGHGIGHSLSPQLHRAGLLRAGLAGDYRLYPAQDATTAHNVLDQVRAGLLDGLNVTTPWKGLARGVVIAHAVPQEAGREWLLREGPPPWPINTVWRHPALPEVLVGASTDGPGLQWALQQLPTPLDLQDKLVVILGAGGAAQSIGPYLLGMGARRLVVAARDVSQALAAVAVIATGAEALGQVITPGRLWPMAWDQAAGLADADVVVHASRLGHGQPLTADEPLPEQAVAALGLLPRAAWQHHGTAIYDLVYAPAGQHTVLERWSQTHGVAVVAGCGRAMLAAQAALSFALWTGQPQHLPDWLTALQAR